MKAPNVCVLTAPGINCNEETAFALEQAGTLPEQVNISQLRSGSRGFDDYQALVIPGGFSYGDDIAAGRLLGLELRKRFAEDINRFVENGKAIIGICNGFQVLVESSLLPYGHISDENPRQTTLSYNTNGKFECRWTELSVLDSVSKVITQESLNERIELPVAHGEGRIVHIYESPQDDLFDNGQVTLAYCDQNGELTQNYPQNPNGSPMGITGLCDPTGIVNGMMPHPERFMHTRQHPNWRRGEGARPFGAIVFKNLVNYTKEM